MEKRIKQGYIALALVSFFWGTTYIASKIGTKHMPGIFLAGVRQFTSGALMVGFFLLRGYKLPAWADLKKIAVQGFFLLCLANGLLTWALEYLSSGLAAIIAALVPLFVALFSIWFGRAARITRWMFIGLLTGFAGVVTIFYDYLGQMGNRSFVFGVILALLSVVSWSYGTVYTATRKVHADLLMVTGLQMLAAGLILLPVCLVTGKYVNLVDTGTEAWYAIAYLVFFGSFVGYSSYVVALNKLPATLVSIYAYVNPIVAVLFGWILLNEKMNAHMILGTLITIGGVWLVNREFKKQQV
jgi:drug/metabolite transporter (DMT)-like permease